MSTFSMTGAHVRRRSASARLTWFCSAFGARAKKIPRSYACLVVVRPERFTRKNFRFSVAAEVDSLGSLCFSITYTQSTLAIYVRPITLTLRGLPHGTYGTELRGAAGVLEAGSCPSPGDAAGGDLRRTDLPELWLRVFDRISFLPRLRRESSDQPCRYHTNRYQRLV